MARHIGPTPNPPRSVRCRDGLGDRRGICSGNNVSRVRMHDIHKGDSHFPPVNELLQI